MPDNPEVYPVTERYQRAFGAIMQLFARCESMIEDVAALLTGAQPPGMHVIMAGMQFSQKRDAVLSLLVVTKTNDSHRAKIKNFLDKVHSYSPLRNAIAHSLWNYGRREGAIKPIGMIVRGGAGKFRGIDRNEPDYTIADFQKVVDNLLELHESFVHYLVSVGAVPQDDMERKTDDNTASISASPGKPSSK